MSRTLFINGRIFTSSGADTLQDAMLIEDEQVVRVGKEAEVRAEMVNDNPVLVDLKHAVVLPGIIDGHTHLVMLGGSLNKVDMLGKTIAQVQQSLVAARKADPNCIRILGCSFLLDALGEKPNAKYIDEVVPDIPVYIDSSDLHSTWLNTAAMNELGITSETPDPKGGSFQKDSQGRLTGLFLETATADYVWPYLASQLTIEQRLKFLDDTFHSYLSTGVTGATEMALEPLDLEALEVYYARHDNTLPIRIAAHWLVSPSGTAADRNARVMQAVDHQRRLAPLAPWLRIAGIKIISDGVVDSCTAYCSKPYFDDTFASPIWPREELLETVALADKHGLQVAIHAIGDAAVDQAIDAIEHAIEVNGPSDTRRHRIEHLEVVTSSAIKRLTRLGIVASLQPVHADPFYLPNWQKMLGHDSRIDRAFPWSEYVDAESHMAFGSDAPTAPYHCFPNMYTATTRQSAVDPTFVASDDPRTRALEKWCVSLDVAVRNYTLGSAYACQAEAYSGSLEPGKSADFCILEIDPFRDGVETLRRAQEAVVQTWLAGKVVFSKEQTK